MRVLAESRSGYGWRSYVKSVSYLFTKSGARAATLGRSVRRHHLSETQNVYPKIYA